MTSESEEQELRSAALQNAQTILAARRRAEEELLAAKDELERKSAQLALALAMARATLESTTDGILVTDRDGNITDFNARFADLWGLDPDSIRGGNHRVVLTRTRLLMSDPSGFMERVDRIYQTFPRETSDILELIDGRVFERFTRQQIVNDQPVGRVWVFRDITRHRRAEQERAYLAAIVTSANDAIISKTLEGIVTSWNVGAERMFGYTAAEIIGRPITTLIPSDRIDEEQDFLRRLRLGERIENFTSVRVRKDGQLINVSLTISPVLNEKGEVIGASKTARDITERERLLAAEQVARARAEEASRLKDEFLATVSHELRTPLNAILGWANLMRGESLDPNRARHAFEVIERNAHTQAKVIEDILDVSRIITGKLRLDAQPVMPAAVIESALESVRPAAEAKEVRLHTVLDPSAGPITGDPSRLQQIVWNLLSNAIKFTGKGGRVEIRLERINSHLEIIVSDTGEGISADFLPYVFDRFRQANVSSNTTGLGLGLSIVRHLVELHGGIVTAHSPGKGKGATFAVRLPLRALHDQRREEERVHPATAAPGAFRSMEGAPRLQGVRILVVDDERDTRELLREVLEGCGAEVRDAGSSGKAVEIVLEWAPRVIVSDIAMSGSDGYTLIRRVRDLERDSGTRIHAVALTACARSEDRMRALLAGFEVHLSKPIEPIELALVVAGLLQPRTPRPG